MLIFYRLECVESIANLHVSSKKPVSVKETGVCLFLSIALRSLSTRSASGFLRQYKPAEISAGFAVTDIEQGF